MKTNNTHRDFPLPASAALKPLPYQRIILAVCLLLVAVLPVPRAPAAESYLPTDVVVPAGDAFRAGAMNDFGRVSGGYTPAGGAEQPVVWHNGAFTQLPLLPGTVLGLATGLNNTGQVVGYCSTLPPSGPYPSRACIWENGTVRELPTVAGTNYGAAWAINDAGTVVGHVFTDRFDALGNRLTSKIEGVVWQGNVVAKLTPPEAGAWTWARAIDNSGRVAVVWWHGDNYGWGNCARWTPDVPNGTTGTMIPLDSGSRVNDINDAGVICGDGPRIWPGTVGIMLPNYNQWGYANSINDAGQVVGDSEAEGYWFTPFVSDAQNGTRDLNNLLAASTPYAFPGTLWSALSINNAGQILVQANSGYSLLTPSAQPPGPLLPQPPTWVGATAGAGTVRVSWNGAYTGGIAGVPGWSHSVKRATVSGGPYTTIATVSNSYSFDDASVVNGTTYYYVVSATDGVHESTHSMEASATPVAPPVAPTALKATALKSFFIRGAKLTWKQSTSTGIVSNRVYRSTSGGAWTQIAQINAGTTYQDTPLSRRVNYSYKVTAVRSDGHESPASNVVSVRLN